MAASAMESKLGAFPARRICKEQHLGHGILMSPPALTHLEVMEAPLPLFCFIPSLC